MWKKYLTYVYSGALGKNLKPRCLLAKFSNYMLVAYRQNMIQWLSVKQCYPKVSQSSLLLQAFFYYNY